MAKIIKNLRNNFLFVASKALDKKIDGREITRKLDESMDRELGSQSEKI